LTPIAGPKKEHPWGQRTKKKKKNRNIAGMPKKEKKRGGEMVKMKTKETLMGKRALGGAQTAQRGRAKWGWGTCFWGPEKKKTKLMGVTEGDSHLRAHSRDRYILSVSGPSAGGQSSKKKTKRGP